MLYRAVLHADLRVANWLHIVMVVVFFNDTATTEIYTLSLHDALPISAESRAHAGWRTCCWSARRKTRPDRKSTRLNSSHLVISYAVFRLKKKTNKQTHPDLGVIQIGRGPKRHTRARP